MTGTDAESTFSTWSVPACPFRIEYAPAVLDEIRQAAVEGYHSVPHGGVETGGILFGTHEKDVVRIKAWRPIACGYSRGPSFLLSEKDEAALKSALKLWRSDRQLDGIEPVGWYRSHTRSEILLADSDLTFYNRFFAQPWQVTLIVRPASFAPTRAGFFFREAGGGIHTENSHAEFVLKPLLIARAVMEEEPAPPANAPPLLASFAPPTFALPDLSRQKPHTARTVVLTALAVILLVAAGFGLWWFYLPRGLSLTVAEMGGELHIGWDRTAQPIREGTGGLLEIEDHGAHTEVMLTTADLRSGSVSYARQSGDVRVRLMVYVPGGPPVSESTRFLKPGETRASTQPAPVAATQQTAAPPVAPPHVATPAVSAPEPAIVTAKPFKSPAAVPPKQLKRFQEPRTNARQTAAPVATPPPPTINVQAALPQAGGLPALLGSGTVPAPAAPVRSKPSVATGRITWTGKLAKNAYLIITGRRASVGAVNAPLPAEPAQVSAYPGDWSDKGITLFTSDTRYAQPRTEAADAANGWNATTFTLEPKRAAAIKIIEQPRQQNGYRLVVQSTGSKLSVIVLEWRAAQ